MTTQTIGGFFNPMIPVLLAAFPDPPEEIPILNLSAISLGDINVAIDEEERNSNQ